MVRSLERLAVAACVVMAIAAVLVPFGGGRAGLGVLGGGVLAGVSYRGLKAAVYGAAEGGSRGLRALAKFFTRHAILAVAAYVMLARLRLPAWAVMAGASSVVVAVAVTALRASGSVSRPGNPR
jgi:hypothetical protein